MPVWDMILLSSFLRQVWSTHLVNKIKKDNLANQIENLGRSLKLLTNSETKKLLTFHVGMNMFLSELQSAKFMLGAQVKKVNSDSVPCTI